MKSQQKPQLEKTRQEWHDFFYEAGFKEGQKKTEERIHYKIWRLDWIKILDRAIKMRPTSWTERPVLEYRNASDEILCAMMHFAKDVNLFPEFYKSERDSMKRFKLELKKEQKT